MPLNHSFSICFYIPNIYAKKISKNHGSGYNFEFMVLFWIILKDLFEANTEFLISITSF